MKERLNNIQQVGKGQLEVTMGGTKILIKESAAPRKEKASHVPKGAVPSLRPLLREVIGGPFDEESYWAEIDSHVVMDAQTAVNKLKKSGMGCGDVAKLLIMSDPLVGQNIAWGRLSQEQIDEKVVQMETVLKPYFQTVKPQNRK